MKFAPFAHCPIMAMNASNYDYFHQIFEDDVGTPAPTPPPESEEDGTYLGCDQIPTSLDDFVTVCSNLICGKRFTTSVIPTEMTAIDIQRGDEDFQKVRNIKRFCDYAIAGRLPDLGRKIVNTNFSDDSYREVFEENMFPPPEVKLTRDIDSMIAWTTRLPFIIPLPVYTLPSKKERLSERLHVLIEITQRSNVSIVLYCLYFEGTLCVLVVG